MSWKNPTPSSISFKDAKSNTSGTRLCILAFTGNKDSNQLDDIKSLLSPRSPGSPAEDSYFHDDQEGGELEIGRRRTAEELARDY